jgi:hypothetical protein
MLRRAAVSPSFVNRDTLAPTQDTIVRSGIAGLHPKRRPAVDIDESDLEGTDDLFGDVILDGEDVGELAIVALPLVGRVPLERPST